MNKELLKMRKEYVKSHQRAREGKLYAIKSNLTDKIYIGCTFQKNLSSRLRQHINGYNNYKKNNKNYTSSYEIIEYGDYYIELIKLSLCTKDELFKIETNHIIENKDKCVNIKTK